MASAKSTFALTIALLAVIPAASAKDADEGYYWYINHKDDTSDQFANFKAGEGYYGSVHSVLGNGGRPPQPTASKLPVSEVNTTSADASATAAAAVKPTAPPQAVPTSHGTSDAKDTKAIASIAGIGETKPADQLSILEQSLFDRSYANEPEASRLDRLEQMIFGASKTGSSEARLHHLIDATQKHDQAANADSQHRPAQTSKPISFAVLMNEGRNEYMQRAFHAAEQTFGQAVERQPDSQTAHYWLAMAKTRLIDYEGAHEEFNLAFRLNPFSDEGKECRTRLMEVAATLEKMQHAPVDSPKIISRTMATIARQSSSLQAQKFREGEATANYRVRLASYEAGRGGYFGGTRWGRGEVSNRRFIGNHYILTDGYVQAAHARLDANHRAIGIQESQNSLLQQLADHPRPGSPQLRAFGTNLYVRYYGKESSDGSEPMVAPEDPPLRASAASFSNQKGKI